MPNADTKDLLQELVEYTKQNEKWLRFLAWNDLRSAIEDTLDNPWEYHAYEMLDGNKPARDIAEELPPHHSTVNRNCKRWRTAGIVIQTDGRKYNKLVSLEALNIDIPELEDDEE